MSAYREPLYLLMLRMTRNPNDAADLMMETFSKAFLQLHRYSPTNTFSSWLFSIGTNTCIDFIRKKKVDTVSLNNVAHTQDNEWYEYQVPSAQPNPEESIILQQRDETLRAVVDQLKEPYREIVELRFYEELSYEEIAQKLHLPLGTVKIRLSRARNLMAATINKKRNAL